MGEATGTAQHTRRAKGEALRLVIDPNEISLNPETVVVKHTRDGGYLCIGLGASADFLRKVDRDPQFGADGDEPFLQRLSAAVTLAKDYDPNQPRDKDGQWTSGGAAFGVTAAAAASGASVLAPALGPALRALAERVLPAAAVVGGAVTVFRTLFIPSNHSLISEGTVPDAPDLGYNFDRGTGVLTLTRTNEDGSKEVLFSDRYGAGGVFRDSDGNVIGRNLDGVVVVDPDAVAGYESRRKDKDQAGAGVGTQASAIAKTDEPKLCPDRSADTPGWWARSERSLAYQEQVSGLPRGFAVDLNGVSYDGCRITDGTMLDAKGQGYAWAFDSEYKVRSFYRGFEKMMDQADRQVQASGGRPIEWHFAEQTTAEYMRKMLADRYPQITVIWEPAVRRGTP